MTKLITRILYVLLFSMTVLMPGIVLGQISASTKLELYNRQADKPCAIRSNQNSQLMRCFVTVDCDDVVKTLKEFGVKINSSFNDYLVAQVPYDKIEAIAGLNGVKSISLSMPMELCNDSARFYGNVDAVLNGEGLPSLFTGRDVIIGIIDTGIDFNHINFKGFDGKSRVKRVYMPQDSTGVSPVIDGDTLPGSHYVSPEQIALLTTDTPNATHGTHTTGTAAGGYIANGLHGVAPEAELVLCGMTSLYDTDIACSIKYIQDYARKVGKPSVISMSFSSQEGAHDGTSPLCRLFDERSSAGNVLVISSGNNARERVYLSKTFSGTANDTLRTYIDNYGSKSVYKGFVSSWSETSEPHFVGITVVDKTTHSEVLSMPMFTVSDSVLVITVDSIPALQPYMTGELLYASAVEDNDRFHSIVQMKVTPTQSRYRIGLKYISNSMQMMRAWSSGIIMINDASVPGYTSAVRESCISDLATGDQAISVGAYCTKRYTPSLSNGINDNSRVTPLDIAYFSSYGPDARGISRPDICAPGAALVSSGNRYNENWSSSLSFYVLYGGEKYPYYSSMGTSMSAPYVAGVIALWLQHSPRLTPNDIRDIMSHTSICDDYVTNGNSELWGYGKIDAFAGMQYVIDNYPNGVKGDLNNDGMVDVEDVNMMINIILHREYFLNTP